MRYIVLVMLASFCFGCAIKKDSSKEKTDRKTTEQIETIKKRVGDTVSYTIPNIIIKDTTIYTMNRQGTTLKTVYDNSGRVSEIDCFSSYVDEITRSNKEVIEAIKTKDKAKEESVDSIVMLYFMLGLSLMVLILSFFGYKMITKQSSLIDEISKKLL